MGFKYIGRAAACLVFSVAPGVVLANQFPVVTSCLSPVEFDGRYYEVVGHNGVTWDAAKDAINHPTEPKEFLGVRGHLATITSEAEDRFVEALRRCARNTNKPGTTIKLLQRDSVWIGGFQSPQKCEPQPECGWQWVNGEGPISVGDGEFKLPSYSNWLTTRLGLQPNNTDRSDAGGPDGEYHLTIGLPGLGGSFGWNDESALGNIGGYVVEYDTSSLVSVINCIDDGGADDEGGKGCQTTKGQTLLLPQGVDEGGSIGVRTIEITDPRFNSTDGTCKQETLTLFGGTDDPRPDLIIPAYLCGSPKFLVVQVEKDFEIKQGTVFIENEPIDALPGNLYECKGEPPLLPLQPGDPPRDPQKRDVVAWQATEFEDMLEYQLTKGTGPYAQFEGALGEFTFDCGSSRGLVRNLSYLVIGMHINFGVDFGLNSPFVNDSFVALTGYKLELLRVSVERSKPPVLKNGDYTRLRSHITNAIKFHNAGQFASALTSIEEFLGKVADSVYRDSEDGINYNGEHLMRANNIRFTYMEKVIPFAP